MPIAILAIALGASLGALLRWVLGIALNALWPMLPLGTLAANLLGGLLVGIVFESLSVYSGLAPSWRLFAITGFLGGLTTFSTFSLEISTLLLGRHYLTAALSIGLHVVGSIGLTIAGIALVQYLANR
ncbi:fluoride efflux transporter CrcB [Pusillimonas sp. TS35]|uniref:fluoride efflux transporter CrcB n=1 Tax=Paracandidimonas lactea TaxID=2895524 RepID=UPI00136AC0FB|nr:fluoride efflux transporter CrcB [Paracandidimonas lactea]MYN12141.1 fluoride efflux transporter CrcB [Pusillimonas sp. TS35]